MNIKDSKYFKGKNKWLVNTPQEGDGLQLLKDLKDEVVQLVIFDPQYEDVKKVTVGGGISDSKIRKVFFHPSPIKEQTEMDIKEFCKEIFRVLKPNGWMMLWMNENILIKGRYKEWLEGLALKIKRILVWSKRNPLRASIIFNSNEYCLLIKKHPYEMNYRRKNKMISNTFFESIHNCKRVHLHTKPYKMNKKIIKLITNKGDLVVDPCAGGFVSLLVCDKLKRDFIGTDLTLREIMQFNINKENSRELLKKEK